MKLTLDDIAEFRAYERERESFRDDVIALKRKRRVGVGSVVTLLFENRQTIRFQVQEMARAERMVSDEAIQGELDAYNPLIPESGQLSATVFIELTSDEELRHWLPKLVGVERLIELRLADGEVVVDEPEADHATQLTRDDVTAAVHYVRFNLTPRQVEAFASGPVTLAVAHPAYAEATILSGQCHAELLKDLRGVAE